MAKAKKLTEKQKRFCAEYIIDLNGKQAAIRAKYSLKTAEVQASRLLSNDKVKAYLQTLMDKRAERLDITADRVLEEIAHIAFDDIGNYLAYRTEKTQVGINDEGKPILDYRTIVDLKDSSEVDTRSIAEVSTGPNGVFKYKMYCKDNALVSLGKHLKLFTDKVEHSGTIGISERAKEIDEYFRKE